MLQQLKLYQLISANLPTGGFTYSQGMEWAVEAGWVASMQACEQWLQGVLTNSIATLELPILLRLRAAVSRHDIASIERWTMHLIASRETAELRKEERQRGQAMLRVLPSLDVDIPADYQHLVAQSQVLGFAVAAEQWQIDENEACAGYSWNWLENMVMAAIKLVPLGQTQGQQLLMRIAQDIPAAVDTAWQLTDDDIGSTTPAMAIASSCHETQYCRLFRS